LEGEKAMSKKPFNITGKLPPVHVRKPWRQNLPEINATRIDKLRDIHGRIKDSMAQLKAIRQEFHDYAPQGSPGGAPRGRCWSRVLPNGADAGGVE
jgi:hypothetical protein